MSSENSFKIMLMGDEGVGKTSLISRYTDDYYKKNYTPTIGIGFKTKDVGKTSDEIIKLQIWDPSGQEKIKVSRSADMREARAIIIVFDVTNLETFNSVDEWLKESEPSVGEDVIKILIATKCDLTEKRVVTKAAASEKAERLGVSYHETSAQENFGIAEVFSDLMRHTPGTGEYSTNYLSNSLIEKLKQYTKRIECDSVNNEPDFKRGFLFFKNSRALNRKANYNLAINLVKNLEMLMSKDQGGNSAKIKELFAAHSIREQREKCITVLGLKSLPDYAERGINSRELNGIINVARKLASNKNAMPLRTISLKR